MKRKGGPVDVTARVQGAQSGASAARTGERSTSRPVGREQQCLQPVGLAEEQVGPLVGREPARKSDCQRVETQ